MKKLRLAALALALCCALSACATKPAAPSASPTPAPATPAPTEEKLAFVLPCYPTGGFHPITGTDQTNLTLAPLLYQSLFTLDNSFQPQPLLCASYSADAANTVWTLQLAPAYFSDGSVLVAADVVSSLNQARRSERTASRLRDVSSVQAAGDYAVTVTLSRPNGALPALLDIPIVRESGDPDRPLGTGAYSIAGEGEDLCLVARAGAAVPQSEIPLRAIRESDDMVYAFDTREVSLVAADLIGAGTLGYSSRFESVDYPTSTLLYVGFNARKGACADPAVRAALQYAFDRENVAGKLLAGHATASALPVPSGAACYDAALAGGLAYNGDTAAQLLSAAGWTVQENGRLYKKRSAMGLKLLVNQESTYKVAVAESLAAELDALGVTVTVEKLPWEQFTAALAKREFDLYLGESLMTADFDLDSLLGPSGNLNYGGYVDGQANALMDAYRAAAGEARKTAATALYTYLSQTAPIVPLCFKNGSVLTQWGQVSGLAPTQRNAFAGLEGWVIHT